MATGVTTTGNRPTGHPHRLTIAPISPSHFPNLNPLCQPPFYTLIYSSSLLQVEARSFPLDTPLTTQTGSNRHF